MTYLRAWVIHHLSSGVHNHQEGYVRASCQGCADEATAARRLIRAPWVKVS